MSQERSGTAQQTGQGSHDLLGNGTKQDQAQAQRQENDQNSNRRTGRVGFVGWEDSQESLRAKALIEQPLP